MELDNVLIWDVVFGKDSLGNLPNVGDVERRNIAQRDARDVLGKLVIGESALLLFVSKVAQELIKASCLLSLQILVLG